MGVEAGIIALRTRPFAEVVLPRTQALDALTVRTRRVIANNAAFLLTNPRLEGDPRRGEYQEAVFGLRDFMLNRDPRGGISLIEPELDMVYRWELTFAATAAKFVDEVFPHFAENDSGGREPGVINMGYALDLLHIIRPDVATFDQGVAVFADVSRESSETSPFILGSMVDDTVRLASNSGIPDLMADRSGALRFMEAYLRSADEADRALFTFGRDAVFVPVGADYSAPGLNSDN